MKLLPVLPLVALLAGQTQAVQRPAPPPIYPTTDDVKTRLERQLYLADFDDVRVLLNFGSNDDERSRKFAEALRDRVVMNTKYSADEYHIVNIEVGKLDKNLEFAKQYGVTLKAELLPMLVVLDEHGKVLARASGKDFETSADPAAFDPAKIAAFFTKHQAPFPDNVAPFEAAIKRAKAEGKTVFVWWSAPW